MIVLRAETQQRVGDTYHLSGQVEILYGSMRMTAEEIDYNSTSGEATARGNVQFTDPVQNEQLHARRAEYNLRQGIGRFDDVEGSVGGLPPPSSALLTTTNPFYFSAQRVDRVASGIYRVYNADVTVCSPPRPTWTFHTPAATIRPGDSAWIRHAQFRLWNVPMLYLPVVYRSLEREPRNSGFLAPSVGNSSRFGFVLGESFFWAISRSMDAEVGGEYLSKRGWSQQGSFRAVPSATSYFRAAYYGVMDRGFGPQKTDQGGQTVSAEGVALLPGGFRGVLNFSHLSSLVFREAFAQTYSEAVNSEVHSAGFATRNFDSFSFNAVLSQTENFQSLQPGDTVRLRTVPEAEFQSVQRPLWRGAPLYIAWESSVGWVSRKEPAPPNGSGLRTGWMERLEFYPRLTLPLRWRWFQMTPTLGYRATQYGKQRQQGALVNEPWLRDTTSLAVDWALPPLEKTYSGAGALYPAPFRHVVEPRVMFRLTNGVGDFSRALLFDERDLIANTRELEYSLTQRVFVKSSDGNPREAFSWEVKQQYYFDPAFGGALVSGERNILPSSLALSGTAFLDTPRRFSPVISILKFSPSYRYDVELREDYDTGLRRFTRGGLTGSAHFGEVFLSLNHSFVRTAPELAFPSNQMGFSLGYGNLLRQGWNAAFAGAYDVKEGFLQFTAFQASYNNNCCGISVEFRRFALGPARNENQFRVAFSIANVGTFGTLKKQERLF